MVCGIRKALLDAFVESAGFVNVEHGRKTGNEAGVGHTQLGLHWSGRDIVKVGIHRRILHKKDKEDWFSI